MEEKVIEHSQKDFKKKKSFLRETFEVIFFTALIVIPIQMFVGRTFIVVGKSMFPTFENKDYLIVDKLTYQFNNPQRGDVVVFHPPVNPKTYYIKRIIGLPGETVYVEGDTVKVINTEHPDGLELHMSLPVSNSTLNAALKLKEDEYFVMGDNRSESYDSRSWGALPKENISGRVFVRLFPFKEIGVWPGAVKF